MSKPFDITPDFYARLVAGDEAAHKAIKKAGMSVLTPEQMAARKRVLDRNAANGKMLEDQSALYKQYLKGQISPTEYKQKSASINSSNPFFTDPLNLKPNQESADRLADWKALSVPSWGAKGGWLEDVLGGLTGFLMVAPFAAELTGLASAFTGALGGTSVVSSDGANIASGFGNIAGTATGISTASPATLSPATQQLINGVSGSGSSLFGTATNAVSSILKNPMVEDLAAIGSAAGTVMTVKNQLDTSKAMQTALGGLSDLTNPGLPPIPPAIIDTSKNIVTTDTSKDSGIPTGEVLPPITVYAQKDNSMIILLLGLAGGFYFLTRR